MRPILVALAVLLGIVLVTHRVVMPFTPMWLDIALSCSTIVLAAGAMLAAWAVGPNKPAEESDVAPRVSGVEDEIR